ncbi:MAG: protein kinase [Pseudomonadota bacterium]|nr:protein kinase [Pseudomonadota bacterium]
MNRTGDDARTELLGGQADASDASQAAMLAPGARLDRYRIVRVLGRGGMGEVYLADQIEPVRRRVALKLLHRQRMDPQHLLRFELERQVLAQMQHPSIAQIHDAGTTVEGHPYFVMEYIDGQPINQWCDQHKIGLDERLALFIQVCEGVQYAHQKGVIHRDLKPGNVLVTEVDGRALPKIIDFGIASTSEDGTDEASGTPDYMSPEQAGSGTTDTRSDVYALGVMLHELLTGSRPARGGETVTGTPHTIAKASERLRTLRPAEIKRLEAASGLSIGQVCKLLRRELDWVIDKALQHERDERYSSVSALVADLRRYLDGQPVLAVPQSRPYVWGKFIKRHRVAVVAAGTVVCALLAGLMVSLYGLREAQVQRTLAEQRSANLEKVVAFQQNMLEGIDTASMGQVMGEQLLAQAQRHHDPDIARLRDDLAALDRADIARQMIDQNIIAVAEAAIERDFSLEPALANQLRLSIAKVRHALGMYQQAASDFGKVAAYQQAMFGAGDRRTLDTRRLQIHALSQISGDAQLLPLVRATLQQASALPANDILRLQLLAAEGDALAASGDRAAGRAILQQALDTARQSYPTCSELARDVSIDLAQWIARMGEAKAGRELLEQWLKSCPIAPGSERLDDLALLQRLAIMRVMSGDAESAVQLQRHVVDASTRLRGSEHPVTLSQRLNLGTMLTDSRELQAGLELQLTVLEAVERIAGSASIESQKAKLNLASTYARMRRFDEAIKLQDEVAQTRTRILGPRHPDTVFIRTNQIATRVQANRWREVIGLIDEVLPLSREVMGEKHPQTLQVMHFRAVVLYRLGRSAEAISAMREVLALSAEVRGPDSGATVEAAANLVIWLREAGDWQQAEAVHRQYLQAWLAARDPAGRTPPWLDELLASDAKSKQRQSSG